MIQAGRGFRGRARVREMPSIRAFAFEKRFDFVEQLIPAVFRAVEVDEVRCSGEDNNSDFALDETFSLRRKWRSRVAENPAIRVDLKGRN